MILIQTYTDLQTIAQHDPNILALILVGSRGRDFAHTDSDWDCQMIVVDDVLDVYRQRFANLPAEIELSIDTLDGFRDHAAWGNEMAWDRYTWAHITPEIDKTDSVLQPIIDEKSRVPEEHVDAFIRGSLDHYINQVYRSIKCLRSGNDVGHRLEAAESIRPMLNALFCLHDRRVLPYYKYLAWDLAHYPLDKLDCSSEELLHDILAIVEGGDCLVQQKWLRKVESLFRREGYGDVFDAWEGKDQWTMNVVISI
ncbi:MAG: hypothetical protein AAF639_12920 [Chloroflexota bacterium]